MSNNNNRGSFPLFGILGVLFVALKLTGVIGWSWWLVLLPFYGPLALALLIAVPLAIFATKKKSTLDDYFDSIIRN